MKFFLGCLCLFFALPAHAAQLRALTTFSILGDMAREVGGNAVVVASLVGPDGDAHAYEPTPQDAKILAGADVLIINGFGFETWLPRLKDASGFHGKVIVATDGITPRHFPNGEVDPHAWQDAKNGARYVHAIGEGLAAADPANAAAYRSRAAAYAGQILLLDRQVRQQMESLPATKRRAITSHDALGYFAAAYGVTLFAPLGATTSGDVTAGTLAHLIDQMRSQHIHAIFPENMEDPRLLEQLAKDGGAVVGGTLYSDALSPPDGPAGTYIALFRHNVAVMLAAMTQNP